MFFFKTKFFFPCSVFSFKNSYTLTRSDVLFLQAKIITKNETVILKKANVFKALPASSLFSFKNKVTFVAAPFFKFNNSLLFSDPKIDSIFLQFEDNYFIIDEYNIFIDNYLNMPFNCNIQIELIYDDDVENTINDIFESIKNFNNYNIYNE